MRDNILLYDKNNVKDRNKYNYWSQHPLSPPPFFLYLYLELRVIFLFTFPHIYTYPSKPFCSTKYLSLFLVFVSITYNIHKPISLS